LFNAAYHVEERSLSLFQYFMKTAPSTMLSKETPTSNDGEVYRPAWEGANANISYGLPFQDACAKHIEQTFKAKRVYIIASGSLSRQTGYVKLLQERLGDQVVGTRYGMQPHSLWSEILEITEDAKKFDADLLITLGAGSLTDGAKIIALVCSGPSSELSLFSNLY
jgi:alcohol dehydrogenase class IV